MTGSGAQGNFVLVATSIIIFALSARPMGPINVFPTTLSLTCTATPAAIFIHQHYSSATKQRASILCITFQSQFIFSGWTWSCYFCTCWRQDLSICYPQGCLLSSYNPILFMKLTGISRANAFLCREQHCCWTQGSKIIEALFLGSLQFWPWDSLRGFCTACSGSSGRRRPAFFNCSDGGAVRRRCNSKCHFLTFNSITRWLLIAVPWPSLPAILMMCLSIVPPSKRVLWKDVRRSFEVIILSIKSYDHRTILSGNIGIW